MKISDKDRIQSFITSEWCYIDMAHKYYTRLAKDEAENVGCNEHGYISMRYEELSNTTAMLGMHLNAMEELMQDALPNWQKQCAKSMSKYIVQEREGI
jgi:hypothetical protein